MHKHGAKIAIQLHHGGREAKSTVNGLQPISSSPLPGMAGETPREMTVDEIAETVASEAWETPLVEVTWVFVKRLEPKPALFEIDSITMK